MLHLIQDRGADDYLTASQRHLLYWHRLVAHMDFERIKDFALKGNLPKEILNCKTYLCPFCIQAKHALNSMSEEAARGLIKSGNLKPGDKAFCFHCMGTWFRSKQSWFYAQES